MNITEIAKKINNVGGKLYLVGGAIRDKLLEKPIHDEDYCITGLSVEKFKCLFPDAFPRGKSFEVFQLYGKEFAFARRERKSGLGHKEFKIEIGEDITIEEDLARRDLTINSIAQNVLTGEIIDPFLGQKDIENKVIRATTDAFKEDPLRVYRAARFGSELGFKIENKTLKLMSSLKDELLYLSKERVFVEFKKALATNEPSVFFNVLKESNVLDVHFKEIFDLIGSLQPEKYHPEGDAYNHTMLALDNCAKLTNDLIIRFSTLVHDLGKGVTPKEEYPHHYNHEKNGVLLVGKLGNRICAPTSWIKAGKVACKEHMRGGIFNQMKPSKKVDFIERVDRTVLGLDGLQVVVNSDTLSSNKDKQIINFAKIGNKCLKEISGKMIAKKYNLQSGIEFGKRLHEERVKWMTENI